MMPPSFVVRPIIILAAAVCHLTLAKTTLCGESTDSRPVLVSQFIQQHCLECHDGADAEAGLDLSSLTFDLNRRNVFDRWVLIHDRVRDGEMPPPDGVAKPVMGVGESIDWNPEAFLTTSGAADVETNQVLHQLAVMLAAHDKQHVKLHGRAKVRRLNRLEYENTLREILRAPWLQIAHQLPEDGVAHLFNKVGEHLDVSHVQMTQYLKVSRSALQLSANAAAHPRRTRKFYAREEPSMQNYLHYRFGQRAATRSIVPLVGLTPEPDVIRKLQPTTVGDSDKEKREREAMGVFSGVYSATTKYDFSRVKSPTDGNYRLRIKTYTFMAGPNGADGGNDHGLTGGRRAWWRPDRNVASIGTRSEPVTLYALSSGGDSRWLTTFDSHPEPTVFECIVTLRKGEGIRPDAARLVRTRPGWSGNPNATEHGVPGLALNWLEVEGPLSDEWPPASYRALFGDLPFEVANGEVKALVDNPSDDAACLLSEFHAAATGDDESAAVEPFVQIFKQATALGEDFTDAIMSAMSAILCSPKFLYFDVRPGQLSESDFKQRLSYFLLNGPPGDHESATPLDVTNATSVQQAVNRMLHDSRSERFINSFLDYWLDLRDINANTPDAELYPDYYLDELLTESSVLETRQFFRWLIDADRPVQTLVDSEVAFVNERLARHYDLKPDTGVRLRRVKLPAESPRGGLLTQASVLRVTANGTTTSPVTRGAWIMQRIMGVNIPPPPSGVAAVRSRHPWRKDHP